MCSTDVNSVLMDQSVNVLKEFSWSCVYQELSCHAPVFFSLLQGITKTKRSRNNTRAVICMCAAILLKHRYNKMSLVQRVISICFTVAMYPNR